MPGPDEDVEEELRRWFRDLPSEHPMVMVLWNVALEQREAEVGRRATPLFAESLEPVSVD